MTEIRNTAIRLHRNKLPEIVRGKLSDKMNRAGEGFFDMDKLNKALDDLPNNNKRDDEEEEHEKQQLKSIAQMIETLEYKENKIPRKTVYKTTLHNRLG